MKFSLGKKTIALFERRPTEDGRGRRSHQIGEEEVELVCEIDEGKLASLMGEKAARNARGVAQLGHGAILVRAINRRRGI